MKIPRFFLVLLSILTPLFGENPPEAPTPDQATLRANLQKIAEGLQYQADPRQAKLLGSEW